MYLQFTYAILYILFSIVMIQCRTCGHSVLGVVSDTCSTLNFRTVGPIMFRLTRTLLYQIFPSSTGGGKWADKAVSLSCLSSFTCAEPTLCVGTFVYTVKVNGEEAGFVAPSVGAPGNRFLGIILIANAKANTLHSLIDLNQHLTRS